MMKMPKVQSPEKYGGLYVIDFGEQTAIGYTADEIAVLLESEKYADAKVYRIHRALPDGTMELQGVSRERFLCEEGMFFIRAEVREARADFDALRRMADEAGPPCRMKAQLAKLEGARTTYVTAIIYPAEHTQNVSDWLTRIGFEGGDYVEGGISQVTDFYASSPLVIDRAQFWSAGSGRPAEEVLASTHLAVQRVPA